MAASGRRHPVQNFTGIRTIRAYLENKVKTDGVGDYIERFGGSQDQKDKFKADPANNVVMTDISDQFCLNVAYQWLDILIVALDFYYWVVSQGCLNSMLFQAKKCGLVHSLRYFIDKVAMSTTDTIATYFTIQDCNRIRQLILENLTILILTNRVTVKQISLFSELFDISKQFVNLSTLSLYDITPIELIDLIPKILKLKFLTNLFIFLETYPLSSSLKYIWDKIMNNDNGNQLMSLKDFVFKTHLYVPQAIKTTTRKWYSIR
ncbi:unnamed protein product [Didymodactylos carnosus]|uniref:DNA-dependent protein kinase catalytic subunit CC1/2 domain-containing protein n=1 Tax=Didymodactylos carnosus TaxID=1234261 RepID=A0A8S2M4E5_9BILA|nr:unnamed protein product [Didymodactylos carnosus]CAF3938060.1 unnamed protein product [Didymodactylos carnosus]